jgi:hypothetical protein
VQTALARENNPGGPRADASVKALPAATQFQENRCCSGITPGGRLIVEMLAEEAALVGSTCVYLLGKPPL